MTYPIFTNDLIDSPNSERENTIVIEPVKYVRKPFYIDAVQVTAENMEEVSTWAEGSIRTDGNDVKYIKVKVHRPANDRQTKAFVGDWVLKAGTGFKVFTEKAFVSNFDLFEETTPAVYTLEDSVAQLAEEPVTV